MRKSFEQATTLEELKKLYRDLALKHHPDRGEDVETMKEVNRLYEAFFLKLKDTHKNKEGETYTKETRETPEAFQEIMERLILMEGVHIEVIGCFVWVSGDTKPHRKELKALGFRWHSKKKVWYKSPEGYRRHGDKEYDMNEIRSMYGVQYESDGASKESKKKRLTA